VPVEERLEVTPLGGGFHRLVARFGFMEDPAVPAIVRAAEERLGGPLESEVATYFLGREAVAGRKTGAMGRFAEGLFGYLQRNAVAADAVFQIPPKQVIEVGIQLEL
jgi:KUP system potassium uptake protein